MPSLRRLQPRPAPSGSIEWLVVVPCCTHCLPRRRTKAGPPIGFWRKPIESAPRSPTRASRLSCVNSRSDRSASQGASKPTEPATATVAGSFLSGREERDSRDGRRHQSAQGYSRSRDHVAAELLGRHLIRQKLRPAPRCWDGPRRTSEQFAVSVTASTRSSRWSYGLRGRGGPEPRPSGHRCD